MNARLEGGSIVIRGAVNPWRLAARIRKYHGLNAQVSEYREVIVASTDRDAIDRTLASE